jgi:hypothetical protein
MKSLDKKRMIYSFYVNDDSFDHRINKLHFKLLERYIHKFDEVIFCIIIDDRERYDLIQRIEEFIISIYHKKLTFKIYDNTNYRESLVFYNEIATQMSNLDGVTFFGHNKGISDTDQIETVEMWVAAMYYFNLEFELPNNDLNGFTFYGALKTDNINPDGIGVKDNLLQKHSWVYCGTFFWGKYQELDRVCKRFGREIPALTNRWYSEMFPGEMVESFYGKCYKNLYIIGQLVFDGNIDLYIKSTLYDEPEDYDMFVRFFNEVIEQ